MAKIEVSMEVVARLKKSAEEADKEDRASGLAAGEKWAKDEAEARDLKRLGEEFNRISGMSASDREQIGDEVERTAVEVALFTDDDFEARDEFWARLLGAEWRAMMTAGFFEGFGEGALAVWEEAKSRF